jgi:hypothetical protein
MLDTELRNAEREHARLDSRETRMRLYALRERMGLRPWDGTPVHYLDKTAWRAAFSSDGASVPDLYERIVETVTASEGENDGASWVGLFKLDDGTFVGITAWCDYTGWG